MSMMPNSKYHESVPGFGSIPSAAFQSECAEGVALDELPVGAMFEVETGHHTYRVENRGDGKVLISGHPVYCPEAVVVDLHGSIGNATMIKMWFIGRGLRMEFRHPTFGVIRTSRVRKIRELNTGLTPGGLLERKAS
jgi:hypothetical protein